MTELEVSYCLPERGLDVAFTVPSGSTTALVGPNGSGKSSTFDVICGLLRPRQAQLTARGQRVEQLPPHRRRIGLLLQQPLLFPTMSVLENAAFGLRAAGVRRAEAHARAQQSLEEVGAAPLSRRRPGSLSGGQSQRVALARVLTTDPDLLLLDEPLVALDDESQETISAVLEHVLAARTAVLITHSRQEARRFSDRLVVLDGGQVVQQGSWAEVGQAPASAFARRFTAEASSPGPTEGPEPR